MYSNIQVYKYTERHSDIHTDRHVNKDAPAKVWLSVLEVYNERLVDLLRPSLTVARPGGTAGEPILVEHPQLGVQAAAACGSGGLLMAVVTDASRL